MSTLTEELRKKLRKRRRRLGVGYQYRASYQLSQQLLSSSIWAHSQRIAFYRAFAGEMRMQPLLNAGLRAGKQCYLPIVEGESMRFVRHVPGGAKTKNKWGIWEPSSTSECAPDDFDLVLVPLVGFDHQGHRIGMGGGFYDRTFAFLQSEKHRRHPFLLGVGYAFQQVPEIQPQSWGIALDRVLTEKCFF